MALKSTKRILRHCMLRLVREKNMKNITVSDICEKAEIGKRTFYRYYQDKYALFEDTYIHEFYNKLNIKQDTVVFEVYERIVTQMYTEQKFFLHAIASKEQNGFWELICNLIVPHVEGQLTSDPYIDYAKKIYIRKDVETILQLIEEWVVNDYKESPEELSRFIRLCAALHGKWQYQMAMSREPDEYSLERFQNNEW